MERIDCFDGFEQNCVWDFAPFGWLCWGLVATTFLAALLLQPPTNMSAKKGEYGVSPMPSEPPAGWKAPSQEEFSKPTVEGSEELDAEAQVGSYGGR